MHIFFGPHIGFLTPVFGACSTKGQTLGLEMSWQKAKTEEQKGQQTTVISLPKALIGS